MNSFLKTLHDYFLFYILDIFYQYIENQRDIFATTQIQSEEEPYQ